ncbi:MAG: aldehyde dehydrogenase family protein [Desertifilum sp. SIO1I2]|nr:aldehyde dehydrogenase family protein [Desertifilum sp. SIO1I2]
MHSIPQILQQQREFFQTGQTRPLEFRIAQLKRLKQAILDAKDDIISAVNADLGKPELEAYLSEIGVVREIEDILKKLKSWVKPQNVKVPIDQFPACAQIYSEPLGVVLVISPWNYPFYLVISPLIAAIAAGNCIIVKPSEIAARTSQVIANLITKTFDPHYIAAIEGGVETSQELLAQRFDHIFFTGGTAIGKIVMEAAAKHLTPVTLELGGKSPCIVDTDIDLNTAARRITWGKFLNTGQTCIAPDYLLVDRQIKPALLDKIKAQIIEFYGENPAKSPDYGRIINQKQFSRLASLLNDGEIIIGGDTLPEERYIAPTIIDNVSWDAPIMQAEIFGPILPVLEYSDLSEAIAQINARPKPLALYLFSRNTAHQQQVLEQTSSGGVCLNDTIMHIGVADLPFGGVGNSGMGSYHGKAGFDTFSHQKSVLKKGFRLDLNWRYAPYAGKLNLIKKIIR